MVALAIEPSQLSAMLSSSGSSSPARERRSPRSAGPARDKPGGGGVSEPAGAGPRPVLHTRPGQGADGRTGGPGARTAPLRLASPRLGVPCSHAAEPLREGQPVSRSPTLRHPPAQPRPTAPVKTRGARRHRPGLRADPPALGWAGPSRSRPGDAMVPAPQGRRGNRPGLRQSRRSLGARPLLVAEDGAREGANTQQAWEAVLARAPAADGTREPRGPESREETGVKGGPAGVRRGSPCTQSVGPRHGEAGRWGGHPRERRAGLAPAGQGTVTAGTARREAVGATFKRGETEAGAEQRGRRGAERPRRLPRRHTEQSRRRPERSWVGSCGLFF